MSDHISALQRTASTMKQNLFASKLTFDERVAAFCAYRMGFPVGVLREVFGLHKSTVNHMVNQHSRHYKKVRETYHGLGHDAAIAKYVTPEIAAKIQAAAEKMPKTTGEPAAPKGPNPRADSAKGAHKTSMGEEFIVVWKNQSQDFVEGWYCNFGDEPFGDSETGKPFNTSVEAQKAGERM